MCLGVPLQVSAILASGTAQCAAAEPGAQPRTVDVALLDRPPQPGDWLLVHIDLAIRSLDEDEARQISDALLAVSAAASGQPFEHLLADLIDREPQLPAHLRAPATEPDHE